MTKLISALAFLFFLGAVANGQDHGAGSIVFSSRDDLKAGASIPGGPRFVSSGQPDEAVLEVIAEQGFTTVVDFRLENEDRGFDEREAVERLGMSYVNVPVNGPDGVNYDNAARLDEIIESSDGRVLLHCGSGNRAAAVFALREKLLGASNEEALAVGKAAGLTRLEPAVRERLNERP